MARRLIVRRDMGTASEIGVDHGGDGKIIAINDNAIAVKWPAHRFTYGRGLQDYAPAETVVYLIEDDNAHGLVSTLTVKLTIGWDNTRKRKA